MSAFDPVWGSTWGSIWEGSFVGGGGGGAPVFQGTYACYPLKNNGKDSITDAEAIVTRLSPKNYETTSGFKTVGDNEGAYTGEGVLLEGEATNRAPTPTDLSGYAVNNGATITPATDNPFPPYSASTVTMAPNSWVNVGVGGNGIIGDVTTSYYIRSTTVDGTWGISIFDTAHRRRLIDVTTDWARVDVTELGMGAVTNLYLGDNRSGNVGTLNSVEIACFNAVNSTNPSSLIFGTSGSPTTRNADTYTNPTDDVFFDAGCFLGDFTSGLFVNGVNTSASLMTFVNNTPPQNNKYRGFVSALWIGSVFTSSNGAQVQVSSIINTETITFNVLRGTNQEIQEGFEYPNTFNSDFSRSGYATDKAAMRQLRADVEDVPPTSLGNANSFSTSTSGVAVSGNTITIDGSYTATDTLANIDISGSNDLLATDIAYADVTVTINSGSLVIFGEVITASGDYKISSPIGANVPLPVSVPYVASNVTGSVDAVIEFKEIDQSRWLAWPEDNFVLTGSVIARQEDIGVIFLTLNGVDNMSLVYNSGTSDFVLEKVVGGVSDLNTVNLSVSYGDQIDWTITQSSGQLILDINGSSNNVATVTDMNWGSVLYLGTANSSGSEFNGIYFDSCIKDA